MGKLETILQTQNQKQVSQALLQSQEDITAVGLLTFTWGTANQEILAKRGVIFTLAQLQERTDFYLTRIDEHPEEARYLKRIHLAWQQLLEQWKTGKLQNKSVKQELDAVALEALGLLWSQNQLSQNLVKQILPDYLRKLSEDEHQRWLKKNLPQERLKELDACIEKVFWEQWKTNQPKDVPAYDQLQDNTSAVLIRRYRNGDMVGSLIKAIDDRITSELLEPIRFGKAATLNADLVQSISRGAEDLKGSRIVMDMGPFYEIAIRGFRPGDEKFVGPENNNHQGILGSWKRGFLVVSASKALSELAKTILNNLTYEPDFRKIVDEEAVRLLIQQLKEENLGSELQTQLLTQTGSTIEHIKPDEATVKKALNKLLQTWLSQAEGFLPKEDHDFLSESLLSKWRAQLEQLALYVYPAIMMKKVRGLEEKVNQLAEMVLYVMPKEGQSNDKNQQNYQPGLFQSHKISTAEDIQLLERSAPKPKQ